MVPEKELSAAVNMEQPLPSAPQPLLIYQDGRFRKADPLPDWYLRYIEEGAGEFDEALERIGFQRAEYVSEVEGHSIIDVSVYQCGDVFYAVCFDCDRQLWQATFGWEDWPGFLAQFVVPATVAANLWTLKYKATKASERWCP